MDYSWALENDEKNGHFQYEGRFQKRFSKNSNRPPKTQEWEMEDRSVLTWIIGERQPLFLAVLKFLVEVPFQNGAFRVWHHCFQLTLEKQLLSKLNDGLLKKNHSFLK